MGKVTLEREMETLLIPLYGKAVENKKNNPIIEDPKAEEIVNSIDYDFNKLRIQEKTNIMMCIRAAMLDSFTKDFIHKNKSPIIIHLGCGLDSRCQRVNWSGAIWYDVDFPEVIDLRKRFYNETDNYHMVGSSVTERDWIEKLSTGSDKNLVIAEGLFMYLEKDEIRTLIERLKDRLESFTLIFDAYSSMTVKRIGNHPSLKSTGANIKWGIDEPKEMESYSEGIKFVEEKYFTSAKELQRVGNGMRFMFRLASLFNVAKRAHRILVFQINERMEE
ncbi:MAG: class I SAM-dependent methyltransferase [Bacillota bacterium]